MVHFLHSECKTLNMMCSYITNNVSHGVYMEKDSVLYMEKDSVLVQKMKNESEMLHSNCSTKLISPLFGRQEECI